MIYDIAKLLCLNGVETTNCLNTETGEFYLNLNTLAKSHLYLYEDGTVKGRYNYSSSIDFSQDKDHILRELCFEFVNSLCNKGFGSSDWFDLCKKMEVKWN